MTALASDEIETFVAELDAHPKCRAKGLRMADAANLAAHAEDQAAVGADIAGGVKISAAYLRWPKRKEKHA